MNIFKNSVGRPSNETIKKRRIIKALALSIAFIAILSITYTLTNINTKRLKGDSSASYCDESSSCYQAGFRDFNFYKEVIDIYNHENAIDLSYNDIITDEQLLSITRLSAQALGIDNITGIEKLVNLTYLDLSSNNISSIDLSNLTKLQDLDLSDNNLTSIDLSNLTNLEELDLSNNSISEIDVSNLTNLKDLLLTSNNIKHLDLSSLVSLLRLTIDYNAYVPHIIDFSKLDFFGIRAVTLLKNETLNLYDEFGITSDISDNMQIDDEGVISITDNIVNANTIGVSSIIYGTTDEGIIIQFCVSDAIESDRYNINYEERYLYTGIDNNEEIINNLYYEHNFLNMLGVDEYNIDIDNSKLNVSVTDSETDLEYILRPYTLGRIDLSSYEVNEKEITVNGVFNYEEVPHDNVELEYSDNTLIVEDLNGNEVDRYTINAVSNNETPNNNDDENNNVDDNKATEKENVTSTKTTLNKFENNAKTYDDIVKYFIIGGISIILIIGIVIYTKKKK